MHGMTDIMMLKFSYIIINLKNHTNVRVGIFSSNHYKSMCGVAKDFTPMRLREANGWIPALQHNHVELTLGWIIYCDELNNTTWLGNMCHAELVCKHTETGKHSTSWEIDGIRWWCPSWFNATWHDTYDLEFNTLMVDMNPWQHPPPPPEIQRLVVWVTYNQDAKTYAPLSHKPLRIWKISVMLLLD